jgi:hypothetical protein
LNSSPEIDKLLRRSQEIRQLVEISSRNPIGSALPTSSDPSRPYSLSTTVYDPILTTSPFTIDNPSINEARYSAPAYSTSATPYIPPQTSFLPPIRNNNLLQKYGANLTLQPIEEVK